MVDEGSELVFVSGRHGRGVRELVGVLHVEIKWNAMSHSKQAKKESVGSVALPNGN